MRPTTSTTLHLKVAFRVSDRSGTPQAGRTPAATPSGSNASVVERMLMAAPPPGSNATIPSVTLHLTPKGSQPLEKCPHATTTLKGSQPELRVSDQSGTPQAGVPAEEYSGERDPEALRGDTPKTQRDSNRTQRQTALSLTFKPLTLRRPFTSNSKSASLSH